MDGQGVRDAHEAVPLGINSGALQNAHDIAEGGLAVAIAECCEAGGIGAAIELPENFDLFGEAPGRGFIVSGPHAALGGFTIIGRVGGDALEIALAPALAPALLPVVPVVQLLKVAVSELHRVREHGLVEYI